MLELIAAVVLAFLLFFGVAGCEPPEAAPTPSGGSGGTRISIGEPGLRDVVRDVRSAQAAAPGVVHVSMGAQLPNPTIYNNVAKRSAAAAVAAGKGLGWDMYQNTRPDPWDRTWERIQPRVSGFNVEIIHPGTPERYGLFAPSILDVLLPDFVKDASRVVVPREYSRHEVGSTVIHGWPATNSTRDQWYALDARFWRPTTPNGREWNWRTYGGLSPYPTYPGEDATGETDINIAYPGFKVRAVDLGGGRYKRPDVAGWVSHLDPTGETEESTYGYHQLHPAMIQRYWMWRRWWELIGGDCNIRVEATGSSYEKAEQAYAAALNALVDTHSIEVGTRLADHFETAAGAQLPSTADIRADIRYAIENDWKWRRALIVKPPPPPPGLFSRLRSMLTNPLTYVQVAASIYTGVGAAGALAGVGNYLKQAGERIAMDALGEMISGVPGLEFLSEGAELELPGGLGHIAFSANGGLGFVGGGGIMAIGSDGKIRYGGPTIPRVVIEPPDVPFVT